mgnify:CR=1 FL=1
MRDDPMTEKKQTELGGATHRLHENIDTLESLIEDLSNHLECLLVVPHPTADNEKDAKAPDHSPVVNSIYEANYKISRLQDEVRDILERLEV